MVASMYSVPINIIGWKNRHYDKVSTAPLRSWTVSVDKTAVKQT
jgi:hypothetical protein